MGLIIGPRREVQNAALTAGDDDMVIRVHVWQAVASGDVDRVRRKTDHRCPVFDWSIEVVIQGVIDHE
jgi:hypothetical protein